MAEATATSVIHPNNGPWAAVCGDPPIGHADPECTRVTKQPAAEGDPWACRACITLDMLAPLFRRGSLGRAVRRRSTGNPPAGDKIGS